MLDDDESICQSVKQLVEDKGLAFVYADNLLEGTLEISLNKPEIVIADFEFQFGRNIMTIINMLKEKVKKVIILTAKEPAKLIKMYPELAFAHIISKGTSLNKVAELATA